MIAAFTSGLAGTAVPLASPFRQQLGRMIAAAREQAARIEEEQRPQPLDGGGYSRPDPDELARAATLTEIAHLLNGLAAMDDQVAPFIHAWSKLSRGSA